MTKRRESPTDKSKKGDEARKGDCTMKATNTALPSIVTRAEWLAARKELLAKEKDLTRHRDAVNAARRRLPMVRIDKEPRPDTARAAGGLGGAARAQRRPIHGMAAAP